MPSKTFPPKFNSSLKYPAIYNLTLVNPNKKYHPKIKKYLANKNIDENDKILLLFASARIHGKEKNYD